MTLGLEHIQSGDAVERNFQRLDSLGIDTGGLSVALRFGHGTVTFTASTNSSTATITHGLGRTPAFVSVQFINAPAFGNIPTPNVAPSSTQLSVNGEVKTAFTGTATFYWLVIG